tara:strand:+ start:1478 stop:2542 length:1065 start_codon:yes stop_codon:yes gene_type:complete
MNKPKLINYGSMGCVFNPTLECNNSKKSNKIKNENEVSKLIIKNKKNDKEYTINRRIKNIKNHEEWTITWNSKCYSKKYSELIKNKEISTCFSKFNKKFNKNDKFIIYNGLYGGINYSLYYHKYLKGIFDSKTKFISKFKLLLKHLKYIFLGLYELNKHNICHNDITVNNIVFNGERFLLIDYGLSRDFNEKKFFVTRMKEEFLNDRIYEAYQFEYIYYPITNDQLHIEQEEIALNYYRKEYEKLYYPVHHGVFHRNIDELRFELLEDILHGHKLNFNHLVKKIDVYSVGMLPFIFLLDYSNDLDIDYKKFIEYLKAPELKDIINLLRNMTEFRNEKRMSAEEAYEEYLKLNLI